MVTQNKKGDNGTWWKEREYVEKGRLAHLIQIWKKHGSYKKICHIPLKPISKNFLLFHQFLIDFSKYRLNDFLDHFFLMHLYGKPLQFPRPAAEINF